MQGGTQFEASLKLEFLLLLLQSQIPPNQLYQNMNNNNFKLRTLFSIIIIKNAMI